MHYHVVIAWPVREDLQFVPMKMLPTDLWGWCTIFSPQTLLLLIMFVPQAFIPVLHFALIVMNIPYYCTNNCVTNKMSVVVPRNVYGEGERVGGCLMRHLPIMRGCVLQLISIFIVTITLPFCVIKRFGITGSRRFVVIGR